jgi:BTB/POZ domain
MSRTSPWDLPVGPFPRRVVPEDSPPGPDDRVPTLSWRGDPRENFSDWKIEIVPHGGDDETTLYHVHRVILAFGKRRSEHFARLFQNRHFQESESRTSRIELEPPAAVAFPDLLDYLYFPDQPLAISTETATALHSLGEYLDMKQLRWDALQFCKEEIRMERNVETYFQQASLFHNETVLDLVRTQICTHKVGLFIQRELAPYEGHTEHLRMSSVDYLDPAKKGTIYHIDYKPARFSKEFETYSWLLVKELKLRDVHTRAMASLSKKRDRLKKIQLIEHRMAHCSRETKDCFDAREFAFLFEEDPYTWLRHLVNNIFQQPLVLYLKHIAYEMIKSRDTQLALEFSNKMDPFLEEREDCILYGNHAYNWWPAPDITLEVDQKEWTNELSGKDIEGLKDMCTVVFDSKWDELGRVLSKDGVSSAELLSQWLKLLDSFSLIVEVVQKLDDITDEAIDNLQEKCENFRKQFDQVLGDEIGSAAKYSTTQLLLSDEFYYFLRKTLVES